MISVETISDLPNSPAVYAMYGGRGRGLYVAYVGIAGSLRSRINQHLVLRDSSIATGVSAVHLNPDRVTQIDWWEHDDFADVGVREAAEIIAFDIFEPVLRSRGATTVRALELCKDQNFCTNMRQLFAEEPSGRLIIPTLQDALQKIDDLEERIAVLESLFSKIKN